jgi:hypothetical protein
MLENCIVQAYVAGKNTCSYLKMHIDLTQSHTRIGMFMNGSSHDAAEKVEIKLSRFIVDTTFQSI